MKITRPAGTGVRVFTCLPFPHQPATRKTLFKQPTVRGGFVAPSDKPRCNRPEGWEVVKMEGGGGVGGIKIKLSRLGLRGEVGVKKHQMKRRVMSVVRRGWRRREC